MTDTKPAEKPTLKEAVKTMFTDRQVLAILLLGIASGLPYVAIGGTLNAWLTTVDVKPSTIGLLSWALLAYAFKFMWAAALQGRRTPLGLNIGPRRAWMAIFLVLITIGICVLALSEPPNNLGRIGLIAVVIALFSASFDIVLAAWRIEIARSDHHLDVLSSIEQLGYRTASLLGGFVALIVADHVGWTLTFMAGAGVMALCGLGIFLADPTPNRRADEADTPLRLGPYVPKRERQIATLSVLVAWAIGFFMIAQFMVGALTDPENYSATQFIRYQGPWIIVLTVIWLGVVAAVLVWRNGTLQAAQSEATTTDAPQPIPGLLGVFYQAVVEPMMELVGRLKWASILVLAVILSYRFTDLIWGGFAYPFYLGENYGALGHTLTEVGFSSKLIGVFAVIFGISLGGIAMVRFGRMPIFFVGAVLAAATNLLFADLAMNARFTDAVLGVLQIDDMFAAFGLDQRMARLTSVIFAENVAVGLASAASVAYLSSIVNVKYAAVQYALLVSLVFLLGVLGRPTIGVIIETEGFAKAFIICALLGAVACVLALIEWIRIARLNRA